MSMKQFVLLLVVKVWGNIYRHIKIFDDNNEIRFIVLKNVMLNSNDSFQVPSSCYIIVNENKIGFLITLESVDAADYCIRLNCESCYQTFSS